MRYQVKLLGTPWREAELRNILKEYPEIVFLSKNDEEDVHDPVLYLYYGKTKVDADANQELERRLTQYVNKRLVQPVGHTSDDFKDKFPTCLKSLNGFFLDDSTYALQSLGNLILSYFGIMDGTRKVFISYHRAETEELAHRLYDMFIKNKYFPFLDAYSINPGVDFQQYLRHELMSSDVMIMLDTPGFNSSEYCMEELNIANEEGIPVIDIRFKIDTSKNNHRFCEYYETDLSAEDGNKDKDLPDLILQMAERSRAKAFCMKRKLLLDEFYQKCRDFDLEVINQGGFMRCDVTHECFIPMTHVPSACDLFKVKTEMEHTPLFSTYSKQVFYNGNYCRPDVEKQLTWWNEYLPIKTYNITK